MDAAHDDDQPFDLPAPRTLAEACLSRAWDDDVDDRDRLLLEQAARVIEHLLARLPFDPGRRVDGARGEVRRARSRDTWRAAT